MTSSGEDEEGKVSPMWGGRFEAGPSAIMEAINASIDVDRRLVFHDITASLAHCKMLIRQGIIGEDDGRAIVDGLQTVREEA
ncbi:MAG: argininosuccinate lyase, partial [Rhodospirillales bacterium]